MTFLDKAPLDYSLPASNELRDLFVLAYRHMKPAEQLADKSRLVPGTFPLHNNMRLIWTELLTVMSNQGNLRELVQNASEDPKAAAYQQRFLDMMLDNPAVRSPEPARPAAWWKGDDNNPIEAVRLFHERLLEKRSRFLDIRVARQVAALAPSVAHLEMVFEKRMHGTGFLIQPDILLTNHHNLFESDNGALKSMTVDFDDEDGFSGDHLVVNGKIETIRGDEEHDWAIVQLEKSVNRPPISLGSKFDVGLDDAVIIIQHPLGGNKQFALDAMGIRYADEKIVQYVADTQRGSSGSPVFNSKVEMIALHHAEAEVRLNVDEREEVVWRNEGIHINQLMQGLNQAGVTFSTNN